MSSVRWATPVIAVLGLVLACSSPEPETVVVQRTAPPLSTNPPAATDGDEVATDPTDPTVVAPEISDATTIDLLGQDLWSDRDAYDSSFALMLPMHASLVDGEALSADFDDFFDRFAARRDALTAKPLDRLQFQWFTARHAVLRSTADGCAPDVDRDRRWLTEELLRFATAPAWQWATDPFDTVIDRIEWRLSDEAANAQPGYLGALVDEDQFSMALAADVMTLAAVCGVQPPPEIATLVTLARRAMTELTVPTEVGGWLLQPGVYDDHPDYAHAGLTEIAPDLEPSPVPGVASDSSHETRVPLLLVSLRCAAEATGDVSASEFFGDLQRGLETQLTQVVATAGEDGVTLTNYMDGSNGIYRYGYTTQGDDTGFGPSELSGTFNLGWWAFAGPQAGALYSHQLSRLPFDPSMVDLYVGPDTTRERNPAFRSRSFYANSPLLSEVLTSAATVADASMCGRAPA